MKNEITIIAVKNEAGECDKCCFCNVLECDFIDYFVSLGLPDCNNGYYYKVKKEELQSVCT